MSVFGKLFGSGSRAGQMEPTAREGYEIAQKVLMEAYPAESGNGYLCCLYTCVFDSDITPSNDGRCGAWHFDFFLPDLKMLFLVRIQKGKIKTRERAWDKTCKAPVQYAFAIYGMTPQSGMPQEPFRLRGDWADSTLIHDNLKKALEPHYSPDHVEEYAPILLCMPGEYLIDLQSDERRNLLQFPSPGRQSIAALCTTDELSDEDCFLFYLDAATGKIEQTHVFRYPDYFNFGTSVDW